MSVEVFKNQLLGYRAALGGLEALTRDICVNCIKSGSGENKGREGLKEAVRGYRS